AGSKLDCRQGNRAGADELHKRFTHAEQLPTCAQDEAVSAGFGHIRLETDSRRGRRPDQPGYPPPGKGIPWLMTVRKQRMETSYMPASPTIPNRSGIRRYYFRC